MKNNKYQYIKNEIFSSEDHINDLLIENKANIELKDDLNLNSLITFSNITEINFEGVKVKANSINMKTDEYGLELSITLCKDRNPITIPKTIVLDKYGLCFDFGSASTKYGTCLKLNIIKRYKKIENIENRPLWKIEIEQINQDETATVNYYIRCNNLEDWKIYYSELLCVNSFHTINATLNRLQSGYGSFERFENYQYFIINNTLFEKTYFSYKSKAVCGNAVEGESYYNDYEDDNSIKVDLVKSIAFGYDKDCFIVANGKMYLNGKVICKNIKEAEDIFGEPYYRIQSMYPHSIKEKIKRMFTEVKTYETWGCSGSFKYLEPKECVE